ncbi:hypothetical protein H0H92_014820 [Tricholoma furcatifolium]|nr:hypothetical protein H0H92_014820 [Tricholoma furcatifolium]
MDSQVTLVNYTALQLDFSKNSMLNAVLTSRGGRAAYTISTVDASGSHTDIKDMVTNRAVATIKRKTFTSDTVVFPDRYGGKVLKLDKWLSIVHFPDGSEGTKVTIEDNQRTFLWKKHPLHRLALYHETDTETPVAYEVIQSGLPPSLVMERGIESDSVREEILVSFLVIEQRLRLEAKAREVANSAIRSRGQTSTTFYHAAGRF